MKVILFGASGMVGSGVLLECLKDPGVEKILSIGRTSSGQVDTKLREIIHKNLTDYSAVQAELIGYDACFFCLGISSAGMSEADYRKVTYDITVAAAQALLKANPNLIFNFVSGAGTGKGSSMWARVKGEAEHALFAMPFKAATMFRPGYIQPVHGVKSKTTSYRAFYAVMAPLYPFWKRVFPNFVTTTEGIGRAMLSVAKNGSPKPILESADIEALGQNTASSTTNRS